MKKIRWLLVVMCLALGVGCASPTEADRQLNWQNWQAAKLLASKLTDQELRDIAVNIANNCAALAKNFLGEPAAKLDYSAEASAKARETSTKDHATSPWVNGLIAAGVAVLGWYSKGTLASFFPKLFGGNLGKTSDFLVEAITRIREKAQTKGGQITSEDLLTELKVIAETDPRVHEFIKKWAHKKEAELSVKL